MSNLNKAMLIGRLGGDPYHNTSPTGTEFANFSLAVSEKGKDKQQETQWFKVTFFGKQAQVVQQYLKKGFLVYVEGRLKLDTYADKKTGQQQAMIVVIGDKLTMLGGKSADNPEQSSNQQPPPPPAQRKQSYQDAAGRTANPGGLDDDIPF